MRRANTRSFVIHIGDMKTGTTAIQWELIECARKASGQGFLFPPTAEGKNIAHHNLAAHLRQETRTSLADWEKISAELSQTELNDAIISSEEFFFRTDPIRLMEALEKYVLPHGFSPEIVLYLRPHGEFLTSLYAHYVRMLSFKGSLGDFSGRNSTINRMLYMPKIENWKKCFGESFSIRPYIRPLLEKQDIVADFSKYLDSIGITNNFSESGKNPNKNPGIRSLAAILWAFGIDASLSESCERERLYKLQRDLSAYFTSDEPIRISSEIISGLDPAIIEDASNIDAYLGRSEFSASLKPLMDRQEHDANKLLSEHDKKFIFDALNAENRL